MVNHSDYGSEEIEDAEEVLEMEELDLMTPQPSLIPNRGDNSNNNDITETTKIINNNYNNNNDNNNNNKNNKGSRSKTNKNKSGNNSNNKIDNIDSFSASSSEKADADEKDYGIEVVSEGTAAELVEETRILEGMSVHFIIRKF